MQNVTVILGAARHELKQKSWYSAKLAKDMQAGIIIPNPNTGSGGQAQITVPAALPNDLWREPTTGVILKKPNVLRADFMEGYNPVDNWSEDLVSDIQWHYADDGETYGYDWTVGTSTPSPSTGAVKFIGIPLKNAAADAVQAIQVSQAIQKWMDGADDMVPALETYDSFNINEGWCQWIHPFGIFTDRAKTFNVTCFGGKYVLEYNINGNLVLYVDIGYNASYITGKAPYTPQWVQVAQMNTTDGGVNHTKPLQITCIPWGYDCLSFLVSNVDDWNQTNKYQPRLTGTTSGKSFLYRISTHEGYFPPFDRATGQYIKTYAAPLTIGVRAHDYHHGVGLAHVRYSTTDSNLIILPEMVDEVKAYASPSQSYQGFFGAGLPGTTPTAIVGSFTNQAGIAYNSASDTQIVAQYTMSASSDGMYTPELWNHTFSIPELIWTPPWPQEDLSSYWTKIRFQRSSNLDTSKAEIRYRFGQNNSRFNKILTDGGKPLRFSILGTVIFDGYIDVNMPTVDKTIIAPIGTKNSVAAEITCQHTALDMWSRLNDTEVDSYTFLDGMNMVDVLVALIKKAGFLGSDIVVDDPNGYIASYSFESFQNANDWKNINPDTNVGDVIRELFKNYWFKPIRLRWMGTYWWIYEAPTYTYTPGIPPTTQFCMVSPPNMTDEMRWNNSIYKMKGKFEVSNQEIDFNVLVGRTIKEVGEDADGYEAVIPGSVKPTGDVNGYDFFPYRSVSDPTYPWFIGRVKVKTIQPPEITLATSLPELMKITRIYYERFAKKHPTGDIRGEWLPEVDVDQFVWVTGLDNLGNPCSYGAWRIEDIDCEVTQDFIDKSDDPLWNGVWFTNPNMSYTYDARYSLTFVGNADAPGFPMFSGNVPV